MISSKNNKEKILAILEKLQDDVSAIKVCLDVDIQAQFNLLSEGHSRLVKRLDTLDEVKQLAEETRDMVEVIKITVKQHSGEITELKKHNKPEGPRRNKCAGDLPVY